MATMPCCAGSCPTMKPVPHQDETAAILSGVSCAAAVVPVASITAHMPATIASIEIPATHQESPPPFLLHEQFRI